MKKKSIIFGIIALLLFSMFNSTNAMYLETKTQETHRGAFTADLGIREDTALLSFKGSFKDFRQGHLVYGIVTHIDSERSIRFQGFATRHLFLFQTTLRNQIVNIVGRFTSYDSELDAYRGNWKGYVAGMGSTHGWISAQFIE